MVAPVSSANVFAAYRPTITDEADPSTAAKADPASAPRTLGFDKIVNSGKGFGDVQVADNFLWQAYKGACALGTLTNRPSDIGDVSLYVLGHVVCAPANLSNMA
ncbi:MAG: hypothetical protein NTW37_03610, partial [Proteobacteria bacterium]|nr:hypothetical protein [Pseudomonadota bacterium]